MKMRGLRVKRGAATLVVPEKETPRGPYFLSNLDQNKIRLNPNGRPINKDSPEERLFELTSLEENLGMVVSTLYCYRRPAERKGLGPGPGPAEAMKAALAKLLVEYYPFAGRLRVSPEEKLMVECTGEGAVFLQAQADARMDDMGDPANPNPAVLGKLVYNFTVHNPSTIMDIPLLMAQVTEFKCGGFVLGLSLNHAMVDGVSGTGFVKAWGELARGLPLSKPPFLDRTLLRSRTPPRIAFEHPEFQGSLLPTADSFDQMEELEYRTFHFGPRCLERVKHKALEDKLLGRCTTFEALTGFVWRARAIATMPSPASSKPSKLVFPVDGRSRFSPPLPEGYFGNAIVLTCCSCPEGELAREPLSRAAGRVQRAIASVDDAFMRSAIDYYEETRARPWMSSVLLITTWARLSFYETDFGWGVPYHSGPIGYPCKEVVMFLSDGYHKDSINLMVALPTPAMDKFEAMVNDISSS